MKSKLVYTLALAVLAGSLTFTSCKKRKEYKSEDGQTSTDNRTTQSENDNAMNDANTVISQQTLLNGRTGPSNNITGITSSTICGLVVDTNGLSQGKVTLNYTGVTCNNRTRTGTIKLTILNHAAGVRWKHAGAVLQVDYISYKVTRASDGKSVEFNGTALVTNKSGGTWIDLALGQPSLITEISSNDLHVSFDGSGGTAVYNINRRFTYTLPGGVLTCMGEGIGSNNGRTSLENYGTSREGDTFTSQVTTPIIWNWTCGWWAPVQGAVDIKVDGKAFDLKATFAVDGSGNSVVVAPNTCAYGFKVEWTYNKKTTKKVFGY